MSKTSIVFTEAKKEKVCLKVAMTGPSGSGKTYSALVLATTLSDKVAFIDTENASSSYYADLFKFNSISMHAPFTVSKYEQAIDAAVEAGFEVLVIDTISHCWEAEGGLLSKKDDLDSRGGNSYANWASITKEHEQFKAALVQSPITIIATMRSKQEYVLSENNKGKMAPKKLGMAPIQRDGMEYEFGVVFDIAMDHKFLVSKDRTGVFDGRTATKMTPKVAEELKAWIYSSNKAAELQKENDDESLPFGSGISA